MTNRVSIGRDERDDYFHEDNLLWNGISSEVFWDAYNDSLDRFPRYRGWFIDLQLDLSTEDAHGLCSAEWRFVAPL